MSNSQVPRELLLTMLTLFWATGTITTSMRDYYDNRWDGVALGSQAFVTVPTGIANFASQFIFEGKPPREWAERLYNVRRWNEMPRGGHFAPAEEPRTPGSGHCRLLRGSVMHGERWPRGQTGGGTGNHPAAGAGGALGIGGVSLPPGSNRNGGYSSRIRST